MLRNTPTSPSIILSPKKIHVERVELVEEGHDENEFSYGQSRLYAVTVAITMANQGIGTDARDVTTKLEVTVAAQSMDGINEAVRQALKQWAFEFAKVVDVQGALS